MEHLHWHKPRLVGLGPRIEGLPDDHSSKPGCLFQLSRLFDSVGTHVEEKRLLVRVLEFWRERGDDIQVAQTLRFISGADSRLGLRKEGIERGEEALAIYERLNHIKGQAQSLQRLSSLLYYDGQVDAAEEAALRVIDLLSDEGDQVQVGDCHHILGDVCRSRGETEKAINHYETAIRVASTFSLRQRLFWIHLSLAELFLGENRFGEANAHAERVKSYAINSPYLTGRGMELQAWIWYHERKLEEAKSEALHAASVFEKIGAAKDAERCRAILQNIEQEMNDPIISRELLATVSLPAPVNFHS